MAKNRATAVGFLDRLAPPVAAKERQEWADIVALAKSQGANFQPTPADWNFYAEQIRKQRYALNSDELKPYFEFNKVLDNGVFYAANQLYGLTFKERHDIPTWSPDMRVFQVYDADGKELAIFMIDPWKRDNKAGGAWMSNLVNQSYLRGTKPVVFNVENFTKPAPGQPTLISWDDVTTMFHEFGHALHGMFAAQTYPTLSGTNVARDFVEFPSQFNENWALDPKVLPHYAVHYQTGQPIPQDLVDKIMASRGPSTRAMSLAKCSRRRGSTSTGTRCRPVRRGRTSTSSRRRRLPAAGSTRRRAPALPLELFPRTSGATVTRRAITLILDADARAGRVRLVRTNGGLTRANGQRFRDMVLSRGNTLDYAQMYRGWAGHDPDDRPYARVLRTDGGGAPPADDRAPPAPPPAPAAAGSEED